MADNELFGNSEQLDTISRRETVKAIRDAMLAWSYMPLWREDKIVDAVKALPSAQTGRQKGKWLPDNNNYYEERFICSVCGKSYKVDTCMGKPMWNFCPCGADMMEDGEQHD